VQQVSKFEKRTASSSLSPIACQRTHSSPLCRTRHTPKQPNAALRSGATTTFAGIEICCRFQGKNGPGGGLPERFFEFVTLPFGWSMSWLLFLPTDAKVCGLLEEPRVVPGAGKPGRLLCLSQPRRCGHSLGLSPGNTADRRTTLAVWPDAASYEGHMGIGIRASKTSGSWWRR
jgi:hypothetical protein